MFATAEAFQEIIVRLSVLRYVITSNTRRGKYDIATDAEDFFAGFLNRLQGWELVNLNVTEYKNYPAIDLGDKNRRIAIQVTAENTIDKIRATIESFYSHDLRDKYDFLIILILSRKLQHNSDIQILKRSLHSLTVWDLDDLLAIVERNLRLDEIDDRQRNLIESLEDFTRRQLPSIVRALSYDDTRKADGLLRNLEVIIGHPPSSAKTFLNSFLNGQNCDEYPLALVEITNLYSQLKDRSYIGNRQILAHAIQYSITSDEFKWRFPQYGGQYISDQMLIFYPENIAQSMSFHMGEQYRRQVHGLQVLGWSCPLEDWPNFLSVELYIRSLDSNFFFLLKQFLKNDVEKLRSVLVDLDFRHLD
nr:SMEK domain-containing protein [uncultured Cupriavidus sp.]